MEFFIVAHENYYYEKLCDELEGIWKNKYNSNEYFMLIIDQFYYRFHEDDKPVRK